MNKILLIFLLFIGLGSSQDTIYFVYNAKNDFGSIVGDFLHKSFAPKTYPCRLCDITYGPFSKKKSWKNYLDTIQYEYEFLYKNHIEEYSMNILSYPVILIGTKTNYNVLVSTQEINNMKNLNEMINTINQSLIKYKVDKNK